MALNNMGLGFVFTAQNLASGTINRLRGQLRGLGAEGAAAGRAMRAGFAIAAAGVVPLAVGVGGLASAFAAADAAGTFEQGLRQVGNVSGATEEDLLRLRDAAIEAGLRTQFSPDQTVQGLAALASLGFNATQSMDLLTDSLNLAAGGGIAIEEATRAAGAAVRVFGIQGEETRTIADRLLRVTSQSALTAGDLSLALDTVSRGAQATGQELNEMLIAMGLVRNSGVDVSVAASSVSSALEFAARNAALFRQMGVDVTDPATGQFRDFLDIVQDTMPALEGISDEAERAARVSELFGRFGKTAYTNISAQLQQLIGTTRNGQRIETIQQAVAALRQEMADAGGTAEAFAENLLNTWEGQKTILAGIMETLQVVIGEGFAAAFRPILRIVNEVVGFVTRAFNAMPQGMRTAIAAVFTATAAFLALGGALTVVAGLLVVVAPFLVAILKVLAVMALLMAPAILATLAFGAAIAAVVVAVRNNWGGLGDFWEETLGRMRLLWTALTEAVERGGFTRATSEALGQEPGIRRFVIGIAMMVHRLRQLWAGFSAGIAAGWARIQPTIQRLGAAVRRLGQAFGIFGDTAEEAGGALPSASFAEFGARVADTVIDLVERVSRAVTFLVDSGTSAVRHLRTAFGHFAPIWRQIARNFSNLGSEVRRLLVLLGVMSDTGEGDSESFGQAMATMFAGIVTGVAMVIDFFGFLVRAAVWAATTTIEVWNDVSDFFFTLGVRIGLIFGRISDTIMNAIDNAIASIAGVVARIPAPLRPDGADALIAEGSVALRRVRERTEEARSRETRGARLIAERDTNGAFAEEASARRGAEDERTRAIVAAVEAQRQDAQKRRETQVIQVQIDGETVARAVNNADRREGARGFVPVPAGAE